ncbi:MAG: hypothetical protein R3254_10955, partial [Thiomicrorhabdus sp.]|nr:hypothetical protein [Thiomicrorhabdus sp.]
MNAPSEKRLNKFISDSGFCSRREADRFEAALCESPCPEGSVYPADIERRWRGLRAGTNVAIGVAALGA